MSVIVLERDQLPRDSNTFEFQGYLYGNTETSFIWVDMPPGDTIRLHSHPYGEIFIILEGTATYVVGTETLEAHAGQIIIAPADVPHKFSNTGITQLKQIDIHLAKQFETFWLE